tara:strand:+ start:537 stop:1322 length:786 start_codon:yes stop_codon:yes gene_type:complete
MATRALIGTIETEAAGNQVLTSTYNHYDGYPESLGKGLDNHYSGDESKAMEISNLGYISFLNPESGEVEAKHKEPADKTILPDDFEEAMSEVHAVADSMGADYVYLYDFQTGNWANSRNYSTKNLISAFAGTAIDYQFDGYQGGDLADEDSIQSMEETIKSKWKAFLEETLTNPDFKRISKEVDDEYEGEVEESNSPSFSMPGGIIRAFKVDANATTPEIKMYIDSLANDIRLNGEEAYEDYEVDDWVEDFKNYIADKQDS